MLFTDYHNNVHFFFFGWMHSAARGILVPQVGVEPVPLALGVHSLNTGPPGMSQSSFFFFFAKEKGAPLLTLDIFSPRMFALADMITN